MAILLLFICTPWISANSASLVLGANQQLVEQYAAQIILKEILKNSKIKLTIIPLPPARAKKYNMEQRYSGDLARIEDYQKQTTELIRVEPSYYYLDSAIFCKKDNLINIDKESDLNSYRVAKILGVAHSDAAAKNHKNPINMKNASQAFRHLKRGRSDLVIDTKINGQRLIQKNNYQDEIQLCSVLKRHKLYVYLNKKNISYAKIISKRIRKLVESGKLESIIKRAEEQALKLDKSFYD